MSDRKSGSVEEIQDYYRKRATTNKYATSPDFNLREVEIEYLSRRLKDGIRVLDVGCGNGYSTLCHAARHDADFVGMDFVPEMVASAKSMADQFSLRGRTEFCVGDVTDLKLPDAQFDIVISQRCLLNVPTREAQWRAMREISRVLKPNGLYLMLEGTLQGLRKLNEMRAMFDLELIPEAESTYNWFSNKFDEEEMLTEAKRHFSEVVDIQRFGMYYFISRVIHPLLVQPDQPKFDARINAVAQQICRKIPNLSDMGHVALFVFRR
jgi:ubiquinone/menaquinone biosynthesis C-methylase UbiE